MLASTSVVHQRGLKSCEVTPTAFVVWLPSCTGGNKAYSVSAGKLDSEDGMERFGRGLPEGTPETHLHVGKAQSYPRSYPTRSLTLRDSFRGAPTRTREKLERFSLPR